MQRWRRGCIASLACVAGVLVLLSQADWDSTPMTQARTFSQSDASQLRESPGETRLAVEDLRVTALSPAADSASQPLSPSPSPPLPSSSPPPLPSSSPPPLPSSEAANMASFAPLTQEGQRYPTLESLGSPEWLKDMPFMSFPRTPPYPVARVDQDGNMHVGVLVVPMYITVTNIFEYAVSLAKKTAAFSWVREVNGTYSERLLIRAVLIDNTGCDDTVRVRRNLYYFESHAELTAKLDCDAWRQVQRDLTATGRVEVLGLPTPLPFGPMMNLIQRDAMRRGVPRLVWAHNDADVNETSRALERIARVAVYVREPFCVCFTFYDIIAIFDVWSLTRTVGEWDQYMWYHNDVDYYTRCRHAQLPYGEAGGADILHMSGASGTLKKIRGVPAKRLQIANEMFGSYRQQRVDRLGLHSPAASPAFGVVVRWASVTDSRMHDAMTAVNAATGRHMKAQRFLTGINADAVPYEAHFINATEGPLTLPDNKLEIEGTLRRLLAAEFVQLRLFDAI